MSGEQFTPGPWRVFQQAPGDDAIIAGGDDSYVGAVRHFTNARLVAAAPDLLAALQDMLDMDCPNKQYIDGHPKALLARLAIAKATGVER